MALWIRSQDKTIIKEVNSIWVSWEDDLQEFYIECDTEILGKYSTKEKAIKVLDLIQKIISNGRIAVRFSGLLSNADMIDIKNTFDYINKTDIVIANGCSKIIPLGNSNDKLFIMPEDKDV